MLSRFRCIAALVFAFCSLSALPAHAGQLFPPRGTPDENPRLSCAGGQLLAWDGPHGNVICRDPTPGVSVSCPAGQVLTGINNGTAVCSAQGPTVSNVTGSRAYGTVYQNTSSSAMQVSTANNRLPLNGMQTTGTIYGCYNYTGDFGSACNAESTQQACPGSVIASWDSSTSVPSGWGSNMTFWVPPGAYYMVCYNNATVTLGNWTEATW